MKMKGEWYRSLLLKKSKKKSAFTDENILSLFAKE